MRWFPRNSKIGLNWVGAQCFFVLSSIWAPSEHYIWALFEFLSKTEHPNLSTFWEVYLSEHPDLSTFFKLGLIWAPWSEHFCQNCSYLCSLIWALFWNLFKPERYCFSNLFQSYYRVFNGTKKNTPTFYNFFTGSIIFLMANIVKFSRLGVCLFLWSWK